MSMATLKRHQLEYVPGKTKPSDMTDAEIAREIRAETTSPERRAQLEDHKAWLREYRAKPVDEQTETRRYSGGRPAPQPPGIPGSTPGASADAI